jgi:uncharacterized protein DUF2785
MTDGRRRCQPRAAVGMDRRTSIDFLECHGVTDWQKIADSGFELPPGAGVDGLAAELSDALADPDPRLRDGAAYAVMATWIERGVLDQKLADLGDAMAARFSDPRIQARTFAALVLGWIIERGRFDYAWVSAFAYWYLAEDDLRGFDPELGWLHAVAHVADLLGVLGPDRRVRPEEMLELGARRMLADTDHVWRDAEEDRLARAIALTLTRPDLTAEQSTGWLRLIDEKFSHGEPGPVPAYASNSIRTLRLLYVLADRGVRAKPDAQPAPMTYQAEITRGLVSSMAPVTWFSG